MKPADYVNGLDVAIHHMSADVMRGARNIADVDGASYPEITKLANIAAKLQEILAELGVEHKHMRKD